MKRIFLSLPMSGRSDQEIQEEIIRMKSLFLLKGNFNDPVEFVDNSDCNISEDECKRVYRPNILYLGCAVGRMSICDAVLFSENYERANGCLIEFDICYYYDIPAYRIEGDSIKKLESCDITKYERWSRTPGEE